MAVAHQAAGFAPDFVAARLAEALALPGRVPVYALAGLPGTGKSTLAAQLAALATQRGVAATVLSLDDFYLGRGDRLRLARGIHPLLARRGPPGSHDVALMVDAIDALRARERPALPRFDKPADTRLPPSRWRRPARAADLLIVEGWFLKTPPQAPAELAVPVNALERREDGDGRWRRWCNDALAGYAPLWAQLPWLTWLQPPSLARMFEWRWQQEQAAARARPGRPALDRADVGEFLQPFERIARQALRTLPAIAERTIMLDARRRPSA